MIQPACDYDWTEATRQEPCPACGKPDWCAIADAGELLRCMRPAIATTPPGYRVIRDHADGGRLFAWNVGQQTPRRTRPTARRDCSRLDFGEMHAEVRSAVEPGFISDWSDAEIGLTGEAVDALEPGWSERYGCVVFPERDVEGRVIGLLRRYVGGHKRTVAGSRRGLTFAPPLAVDGTVLVVEGVSDVAAATQAGFTAVGRPSNTGGGELLAVLLADRDVIVLGENDRKPDGSWPGRDGVEHISTQLANVCRSVRTAYPPAGVKDIRAWLIGGAT